MTENERLLKEAQELSNKIVKDYETTGTIDKDEVEVLCYKVIALDNSPEAEKCLAPVNKICRILWIQENNENKNEHTQLGE